MIFLIGYAFRLARFIVGGVAKACSAASAAVRSRLKRRRRDREERAKEKERVKAKEAEPLTEDIYGQKGKAVRKGSCFRRFSQSKDGSVDDKHEVTVAESHNPMHAGKRPSVSDSSPPAKRHSIIGGLLGSKSQLPEDTAASPNEKEAKTKSKGKGEDGKDEGATVPHKTKRRSSLLSLLGSAPKEDMSDDSSETKETAGDKEGKEKTKKAAAAAPEASPRRSLMGSFLGRKDPVEEPAEAETEAKSSSRGVMAIFAPAVANTKKSSEKEGKPSKGGKDEKENESGKSSQERAREALEKKKQEAKKGAAEMKARSEKLLASNVARAKDLGKRGAHKVSKRAKEAKARAVAMVPLKYRVMAKLAMKSAGVA